MREADASPLVSVIVPARNAESTIGNTLTALAEQDISGPYEVIVVDNASDDATAEVAELAPGPVSVIRQSLQRPGAARNRGAGIAGGRCLAFTDADCVPTGDWLRRGVAALRDADLVQGAVLPDPRRTLMPFDRTVWVRGETGLYETANLFVRRDLFARLGGFEDWLRTDIERPFGEDVLFGWRARRAGARTAFADDALVHHAVFPGSVAAHARTAWRRSLFCALAATIPELRTTFFYRRWFLNRRSAAFDLALAGAVTAAAVSSSWPLAALAPYAWLAGRQAVGWRRHAPRVLVAHLLADAVGFVALCWGSARYRAPVL